MFKFFKYTACTVFTMLFCFLWIALWQADREAEKTENLVEQNPTLYPDVCELHTTPLQWDRVRIVYGLILSTPNDKERYPHSSKWVGGGCVGGGSRYGWVMYCKGCREAESVAKQIKTEQEKD